ncbi:predicted protein [Sclerotinia sclerotiorum 1980 UF-70]|uniref:Uncharacterized protein n=1 Tax=Sclerotinia sclerotiorum (strain ATCC 18683 / 1980 / Ss-1) TaxID=665079 RepID=A7E4U2_SCLS1|nr:predicted protein [Sclerotinia sclerotiorum 1980 UF-70]EDN90914.1 predicted protein [Sclerotinia sclerotiorum 1980 UF-70]
MGCRHVYHSITMQSSRAKKLKFINERSGADTLTSIFVKKMSWASLDTSGREAPFLWELSKIRCLAFAPSMAVGLKRLCLSEAIGLGTVQTTHLR